MNSLEEGITFLVKLLQNDSRPSVRIAAIQSLARVGCYYPIDRQLLYDIANQDPDPDVSIAAIVAITDLILLSLAPQTENVTMNFYGSTYGVAGIVQDDQNIHPTE